MVLCYHFMYDEEVFVFQTSCVTNLDFLSNVSKKTNSQNDKYQKRQMHIDKSKNDKLLIVKYYKKTNYII